MPLTVGEVADAGKIERGLAAVEDIYRRNGYFTVRLLSDAVIEDAASVRYRVRIVEGQQYRMGSCRIAGLPEEVASRIRSAWPLAEGAVFDSTYPARFVRDIRQKESAALAGISEVKTSMEPEPGTLVINVTLTFVGRLSRSGQTWPAAGSSVPLWQAADSTCPDSPTATISTSSTVSRHGPECTGRWPDRRDSGRTVRARSDSRLNTGPHVKSDDRHVTRQPLEGLLKALGQ